MKDDAQKTAQTPQMAGAAAPAPQLNPEWETPLTIVDGVPYMHNSRGHLVAAENVSARDKLEDQLVRGICGRFEAEREALTALRQSAMQDVRAFREVCAEQYEVTLGGGKGNVTLTSFDGSLRVQVAMADVLTFNSDLEIAEQLIRECLNEWFQGSGPEARTLVDRAFRRNDKGQLSTSAVLDLRTLKFENPKWIKAMGIIADALRVLATKEFIRAHKRNASGGWEHISLDIAKV